MGVEGDKSTQNIFREVNERIADLNRSMDHSPADAGRLIELFCECGRPECHARIRLTQAEYRRIRANPAHFVLLPYHEVTLVERPVERSERYTVVENEGRAAATRRQGRR